MVNDTEHYEIQFSTAGHHSVLDPVPLFLAQESKVVEDVVGTEEGVDCLSDRPLLKALKLLHLACFWLTLRLCHLLIV